MARDPEGPYVVWEDGGYDGWVPHSYATLKEALSAQRYSSGFVVTKIVKFDVTETEEK